MKVDLCVAKVLEAKRVEGTDKLVHLKIDVGDEQRDIIAGIAEYYEVGDLVGKSIVVVANLAPRKLRGIMSHGMLLAAHGKEALRLLTVDGDCEPGSKIS